jgi:hypothetical protein
MSQSTGSRELTHTFFPGADESIVPAPQLWVPRHFPIHLIEIHSTRGGSLNEYRATKNWMQSPNNNQGGWGGACSYIVSDNGLICHVLDDEQQPTYGAGYGRFLRPDGWALDEYGIAVELCQPYINTPFTEVQLRAAAKLCAWYCEKYGISLQFLSIPDQSMSTTFRTGFVRHDRSENGTKFGKSDPGPQFNEDQFLQYVHDAMKGGDEDMPLTDDQARALDALGKPFPDPLQRKNTDGTPFMWPSFVQYLHALLPSMDIAGHFAGARTEGAGAGLIPPETSAFYRIEQKASGGGIDLDKLADKVADKLAARLKD